MPWKRWVFASIPRAWWRYERRLGSSARALPAQAPRLPQPDHEHQPRLRPRRGRDARGTLPGLPRGEGEGRDCAHHVRGLVQRFARLAVELSPAQRPRRSHRLALAALLEAHPRPRRPDHVPGEPPGRAGRAQRGRTARPHRPVSGARDPAPRLRREMDEHDIARVVADYAEAAARCREGGSTASRPSPERISSGSSSRPRRTAARTVSGARSRIAAASG